MLSIFLLRVFSKIIFEQLYYLHLLMLVENEAFLLV